MKLFVRNASVLMMAAYLVGCAFLLPDPFAADEITFDYTGSPAKALPRGWSVGEELMAEWGAGLNEILGSLPDTTADVEYWKDEIEIESGKRLPILRARIRFDYPTRLNTQRVELRFVNVDYIYNMAESSADHYMLEGVTKTIELTTSGYPQILADDVLRKKVLMVYGTPQSFNGVSLSYSDEHTLMSVRVLDSRHLMFTLSGYSTSHTLQNAIFNVYSEEGIDLKKEEILQEFEL
jgi:hypothetical protein